jgi:pilus assembly protein Flp/PilA
MKTLQSALWDDTTGATAVEYALLVALIAVIIVGAVTVFGRNVNTMLDNGELHGVFR